MHLLAVPQHGEIRTVGLGAHQLVQDVVCHKAAAAVHRQNLVPCLQAGLPAEGTVLNGVDGLAGDGLVLGGDQNHQHHKAQHEIHDCTSYHDQCPLPYRRFIQGDAGELFLNFSITFCIKYMEVMFRSRKIILLCSVVGFCLLAFGAFLSFQRYKAAHRQGAQAVLGTLAVLFPEHRPHADGKLVDLNAAELCHSKMPELVDGDHRAEHKQRSKDGNNK